MAYDEDLADRLRLLLSAEGLTEKRMFGGLAFLVDGHMAVAVSGQGGLMVRVDPAETDALLDAPGAAPFEMLRAWAERGVAYARSLPPK